MKKKVVKQVRIEDPINIMLVEIVAARKSKRPGLAETKQSTIADLVMRAHKRECKQ